jgi:hypothetical protein
MVNCCYPMSIPDKGTGSGFVTGVRGNCNRRYCQFQPNGKDIAVSGPFGNDPVLSIPYSNLHSPNITACIDPSVIGSGAQIPFLPGGIDFFFIDAKTGCAYPCGYRGNTNMGSFEALNLSVTLNGGQDCRECDWECFRDPSELMGPVLVMRNRPVQAIKRMATDRTYTQLWLEDLRYYHACGFFDGRKAPDQNRLRRYVL